MLAKLKWRIAAASHEMARRGLHQWTRKHVRVLCEKGEHYLAARLLRVVGAVSEKRFGGTLINAYLDVIHSAVLEAQIEALDARMHGDGWLADEYVAIGNLLRRCHFVPWWAWWMRWIARRRLGLEQVEPEHPGAGNEDGGVPPPPYRLDARAAWRWDPSSPDDVRSTRAWWFDVQGARRSRSG